MIFYIWSKERTLIECCKAKTQEIDTANQNKGLHGEEPIRTRRRWREARETRVTTRDGF